MSPLFIQNCFCLVTKSCLTLCDPMDCSTPGFSVLHYLPAFAQIHVYWIISSSAVPFCFCLQSFPAKEPHEFKSALLIPLSIVWIHTALFCNATLSGFGCSGPSLLYEAFLLFRPPGSRVWASAVVVLRRSCPTACGIFPDQGSNPCPLPWQVDSYPLDHQGSSTHPFLFLLFPPVNSKIISG